MGGAMELVHGVKNVVVAMTHLNEQGEPKILKDCELPLTGQKVVDTLITDLAVFRWIEGKMTLCEISKDITLERLKDLTPAEYKVSSDLKII